MDNEAILSPLELFDKKLSARVLFHAELKHTTNINLKQITSVK